MISKTESRLVIGIDPAYHASGFGIAIGGVLVSCLTYRYGENTTTMSQKRADMKNKLERILIQATAIHDNVRVIFERTRTRNDGAQTLHYAMITQMLIGTIIDTAANYNVNCYSVMTASWKSKTCGTTTKPEMARYILDKRDKPKKAKAVDFIEALGFDCTLKDANGRVVTFKSGPRKGIRKEEDDKADAGCLALYDFIPEKQKKLENETLK